MVSRVLVANRGEIAVRVIRALRELGIESVAIYSTADKEALHAELADEAVCIGPARSKDSYADPLIVLNTALTAGCDAVHPGYGFLSEQADFAKLCEDVNLTFIGPKSDLISRMGDKQVARETMSAAGVPTVPGSEGLVFDFDQALEVAEQIGYPLMIKAVDGGGGKGMRRVDKAEDFETLFKQAQNETQAVYGNSKLYIEQVIEDAKHIEIQILADNYGNVIHIGERDCSLQRNNQKVVEFAPAITLEDKLKEEMYQVSVDACAQIGYTNAGTIEYLVDKSGSFYFMEMNTRLQVEHPISEMVSGVDIVKEQIKIASGSPLSYKQDDIQIKGFAIEARLNAEDPKNNFRPSSGKVNRLLLASGGLGLRLETGIYSGYTISPHYDSMIAKVVTYGSSPEDAFSLMGRALSETVVEGVETNIEFLEEIIMDEQVQAQNFTTQYLEETLLPNYVSKLNKGDE